MKRLLFVILLFCFNCTISAPNKYVLDCENYISQTFPLTNTPYQNFMQAYLKFKQGDPSFETLTLTKEYFKELLNNVELVDWDSIASPMTFCEQRYKLQLVDCTTALFLIGCLSNMQGREAFAHLYLNKTENDLTAINLVPNKWPVYDKKDSVLEKEAKFILKNFLELQSTMAKEYYFHILEQVRFKCNESRFKTALQFCEDVVLKL